MSAAARRHVLALVLAISVALGLAPKPAEAAPARAVGRAVMRKAARIAKSPLKALLRRDRARDLKAPARRLTRDVTVRRYTSASDGKAAVRSGLRAGSHFTSPVRPGRLPSAATAQTRYGLPRRPAVALRVQLPKGTWVRRNKALGGTPGRGEMTTVRKLPASAVRGTKALDRK